MLGSVENTTMQCLHCHHIYLLLINSEWYTSGICKAACSTSPFSTFLSIPSGIVWHGCWITAGAVPSNQGQCRPQSPKGKATAIMDMVAQLHTWEQRCAMIDFFHRKHHSIYVLQWKIFQTETWGERESTRGNISQNDMMWLWNK